MKNKTLDIFLDKDDETLRFNLNIDRVAYHKDTLEIFDVFFSEKWYNFQMRGPAKAVVDKGGKVLDFVLPGYEDSSEYVFKDVIGLKGDIDRYLKLNDNLVEFSSKK